MRSANAIGVAMGLLHACRRRKVRICGYQTRPAPHRRRRCRRRLFATRLLDPNPREGCGHFLLVADRSGRGVHERFHLRDLPGAEILRELFEELLSRGSLLDDVTKTTLRATDVASFSSGDDAASKVKPPSLEDRPPDARCVRFGAVPRRRATVLSVANLFSLHRCPPRTP